MGEQPHRAAITVWFQLYCGFCSSASRNPDNSGGNSESSAGRRSACNSSNASLAFRPGSFTECSPASSLISRNSRSIGECDRRESTFTRSSPLSPSMAGSTLPLSMTEIFRQPPSPERNSFSISGCIRKISPCSSSYISPRCRTRSVPCCTNSIDRNGAWRLM